MKRDVLNKTADDMFPTLCAAYYKASTYHFIYTGGGGFGSPVVIEYTDDDKDGHTESKAGY